MASAVEQFTSRTGDVSADRNGFSASRIYLVTVDNVNQNPDDLMRNPSATTGVGTTAIPFGTPHPSRIGLFSAFYVVGARIRSLQWFVRVIYAPPVTLLTQDNIWELSYQPGSSSVIVRHDWRGVPIGPAVYEAAPSTVPAGKSVYNVTIPANPSADPPVDAKVLDLIRVDGPDKDPVKNPAFLTDVERTEPVGSFTMTAIFPGLNVELMSNIVLLSNIVNRKEFKGFPPSTVKFIGPAANAGRMTIPETATEGFAWRVTLVFEWNSTGYRYKAQDVFEHPAGVLPVTIGGEPVIREWLLYREGDLNVIELMVAQFGNPTQPIRLGIRQTTPSGPAPIGGGRP